MTDDSPDGSSPHLMGEELLFLKAVSLCHTVQISYDQPDSLLGGDPFSHANGFSSNNMEYYASSPDEKALVEATKRIGVAFTGSSGDTMEIQTFGKSEKYKLLHVLEFDPDRRRMSVILQTPSGGKVLFTKGAESAILPFATIGEIEKTRLHVDEFALKGLRTLVVACRHFSPEEYIDVDKRLTSARTALQQREEKLQEAFAYIERDLQLLGATGVEDKYDNFEHNSE
ncbi:putative phospholipid-transporting ATPase IF [Ilyodon furcidens]